MFWWTTLLYTLPITEQELISQCEIVLVYVKDGIYGELEKIRGPTTKSAQSTDHDIWPISSNIDGKNNLSADGQNYSVNTEKELSKPNYNITGSTPAEMGKHDNEVITPESVFNRQDHDDTQSNPMTMQASHNPKSGSVIPENAVSAEDVPPDLLNSDSTGRPNTTLPGIDVFLSRTCTIPLVRCDFDLIKKAVKTQDKQTKESEKQREETSTEAPTQPKMNSLQTLMQMRYAPPLVSAQSLTTKNSWGSLQTFHHRPQKRKEKLTLNADHQKVELQLKNTKNPSS